MPIYDSICNDSLRSEHKYLETHIIPSGQRHLEKDIYKGNKSRVFCFRIACSVDQFHHWIKTIQSEWHFIPIALLILINQCNSQSKFKRKKPTFQKITRGISQVERETIYIYIDIDFPQIFHYFANTADQSNNLSWPSAIQGTFIELVCTHFDFGKLRTKLRINKKNNINYSKHKRSTLRSSNLDT